MNESYDFISTSNNETNTENWNVSYFNDNSTNKMEKYMPTEQIPPFLTILFIVAGTIGNSLVCLAILLDRKLQNLTNYFLLSLAVTDLLISLLILPGRLATVRYVLQPSIFPLCFLYLVGDDFITAASAIHICFISLERYFAIRNPLNRSHLTKRRVAIKISLVWVIAFLSVIPYMTLAIITEHPSKPDYCVNLLSNFAYFDAIILIEALIIVVMIVVVVVSFILTTSLLHKLVIKQKKNTTATGDGGLIRTVGGKITNNNAKNKKACQVLESEKKALRVIWLVSFAFIISLGPYTCLNLFYFSFPDIKIPPVLLDISAYLSYFNSVINPVIYTIFNKTFRRNFKNLILFKYKKDK